MGRKKLEKVKEVTNMNFIYYNMLRAALAGIAVVAIYRLLFS